MTSPTLPCRTCGHAVSPLAKTCPNCGVPNPTMPPNLVRMERLGKTLMLAVTIPVLVLLLFGMCLR